jgi:hypothetical protein
MRIIMRFLKKMFIEKKLMIIHKTFNNTNKIPSSFIIMATPAVLMFHEFSIRAATEGIEKKKKELSAQGINVSTSTSQILRDVMRYELELEPQAAPKAPKAAPKKAAASASASEKYCDAVIKKNDEDTPLGAFGSFRQCSKSSIDGSDFCRLHTTSSPQYGRFSDLENLDLTNPENASEGNQKVIKAIRRQDRKRKAGAGEGEEAAKEPKKIKLEPVDQDQEETAGPVAVAPPPAGPEDPEDQGAALVALAPENQDEEEALVPETLVDYSSS